jgi:hypothetical protein
VFRSVATAEGLKLTTSFSAASQRPIRPVVQPLSVLDPRAGRRLDRDLCDKSSDLVLFAASLISSSKARVRVSRSKLDFGRDSIAKRSVDFVAPRSA